MVCVTVVCASTSRSWRRAPGLRLGPVCNHEGMATWSEFTTAEPALAALVHRLFADHKHHTMATLRRDGSPRISGTEVEFDGGDVCLGMMSGALRATDLRRDPRVAIHGHTVDPPEGDPGSWCGDAKLSGLALEVVDEAAPGGGHRFRVDITEVVLTRVGSPPDHLVIESWHPDKGLVRRRRR